MSANSKIEWTDHTFNTHWGCSKVSPGCDGCYAERLAARFGYGWGDGAQKREFDEKHWQELLRWDRKAQAEGVRRRVFTNSMSDLFDRFAPAGVRERHFSYVERTPHLDHLLLTKRIGNVARMVPQRWLEPDGWPANVWLGATVVNQAEADRDIPKLLAVPAAKRFLSMEPLLGPVDLSHIDIDGHSEIYPLTGTTGCEDDDGNPAPNVPALDWVIVGGESGPGARPMHPDWARSLRDQCKAAGVPFLFKQWGEWFPISQQAEEFNQRLYRSNRKARPHEDQGALDDCYGRTCTVAQAVIHEDGSVHPPLAPMAFLQDTGAMLTFKTSKKAAGRAIDGREWNEVPA